MRSITSLGSDYSSVTPGNGGRPCHARARWHLSSPDINEPLGERLRQIRPLGAVEGHPIGGAAGATCQTWVLRIVQRTVKDRRISWIDQKRLTTVTSTRLREFPRNGFEVLDKCLVILLASLPVGRSQER